MHIKATIKSRLGGVFFAITHVMTSCLDKRACRWRWLSAKATSGSSQDGSRRGGSTSTCSGMKVDCLGKEKKVTWPLNQGLRRGASGSNIDLQRYEEVDPHWAPHVGNICSTLTCSERWFDSDMIRKWKNGSTLTRSGNKSFAIRLCYAQEKNGGNGSGNEKISRHNCSGKERLVYDNGRLR